MKTEDPFRQMTPERNWPKPLFFYGFCGVISGVGGHMPIIWIPSAIIFLIAAYALGISPRAFGDDAYRGAARRNWAKPVFVLSLFGVVGGLYADMPIVWGLSAAGLFISAYYVGLFGGAFGYEWQFKRSLLTYAVIACLVLIPLGIAMQWQTVWVPALFGMAVGSYKLYRLNRD